MTAAHAATDPSAGTFPGSRYHLTFGRVFASEWVKLRSLRSSIWTLLITVVVMVGFTAMFAAIWSANADDIAAEPDAAAQGGTAVITIGVSFAQLVIAVLGALIITGEYSTGMIRSTFSAVPGRISALLAKASLLALVTIVVTAVATAISYAIAVPFLSGTPFALDLGDSTTLRILIGIPLYLAAIAVLAIGLGTLLRNTAGTIFSLVALLLVLPGILSGVPLDWLNTLSNYLPSTAGAEIISPVSSTGLTAWEGYGVLLIWMVVVFVGSLVVAKKRDA